VASVVMELFSCVPRDRLGEYVALIQRFCAEGRNSRAGEEVFERVRQMLRARSGRPCERMDEAVQIFRRIEHSTRAIEAYLPLATVLSSLRPTGEAVAHPLPPHDQVATESQPAGKVVWERTAGE
jgi:hypothetical protein